MNPEGKVPTLLIDGRPLTEVAAILFYLGRRFPDAGLLPAGAEEQAQVVSWMSFAAATLHPARRRGLDHAMAAYAIADARLAGRDWAAGAYSVADIHLFRLFLAVQRIAASAAGGVPEPARASPADAGASGGGADDRDGGGDRI